jgi:hypothetical protein
MTDLQHDLIKKLSLHQYYLAPRLAYSGRKGYMLYSGNANPVKWYPERTVRKSVLEVLKKDKSGRLTLNLNLVRQQHGKTLLKKFYKQKTKQTHGIRSNQPQKTIQI